MAETTPGKHRYSSYSALQQHRRCPRQWAYARVQKLEQDVPEGEKRELSLGTWWHAILALHYLSLGKALGSLKFLPEAVELGDGMSVSPHTTVDEALELAGAAWLRMSAEAQDDFEDTFGEPLEPRLRYMYETWAETYKDELANEVPLAVEYRWKRRLPPLPQPDGTMADPETTLVGYIDLVYKDLKRNMVVARDYKTGKSLSTQTVLDDMMNSQLQLYAWGSNPEVETWGYGPVRAVSYDRIRSMKPKTPKVTNAGGLGKTITDFDLRTYVEWANGPDGNGQPFPGTKKDGSNAGFYLPDPAVIESLSGPAARSKWMQRTLTPLSLHTIRAHLRSAVDTAFDSERTYQRATMPGGEAARNLGDYCKWCPFSSLCRAEMVGGIDGEYDLADHKLRKKDEKNEK